MGSDHRWFLWSSGCLMFLLLLMWALKLIGDHYK